jgi:hypothetical protein
MPTASASQDPQAFPQGQDPRDATYGPSLSVPTALPPPEPLPLPWELPGAALRQYNPIMWAIDAYMRPIPDATPVLGYSAAPRVVGTRYEPYLNQFLGDVNPVQTEARMTKIDRDLQDQRWLAASHGDGTVAIIVAIAENPLWILPIWVAMRLWKQQAASTSAKADLISKEMKKDSFRLLVFVIVSLRKAWRCVTSSLRLAYGRVRDAVHDAEKTR